MVWIVVGITKVAVAPPKRSSTLLCKGGMRTPVIGRVGEQPYANNKGWVIDGRKERIHVSLPTSKFGASSRSPASLLALPLFIRKKRVVVNKGICHGSG